jgi:hypothetical protein
MKMDIVAGSGDNEFYTPPYAVTPILKYIPTGSKVWCPFDTDESLFVKMLTEHGCIVENTHIFNGQDFFSYAKEDGEIKNCDYIVSNPPYSLKTEVLQRLFELDKPFAMLLGVVGLFESQKRFEMFRDNEFEIMYLNKRVSYFKDYAEQKPSLNPPFSSVYVCHNALPKQIVFETIERK